MPGKRCRRAVSFVWKHQLVHLDKAYCKPYFIEPGRYVRISVTDTGMGMDEKTRQRVFDPFFTTKKMGRGTGLGLASAYGIVKNHSGTITVYSEAGEGTTFNIYLPFSGQDAKKDIPLKNEIAKGTGTILLVDDEPMIIDVGKQMLEKVGYDVITAKSGREAVQIFSKHSEHIHLVILDMIMPGMDGSKTFDQLRDINPSIPVLLSSGYSLNGRANKIIKKGCNGFIQKPFPIEQLSEKIKQILDER
jgi:two-component system cell cycle sensor histidine kinase/response regulator CckA